MQLEEKVRREIEKTEKVFKGIKIIDEQANDLINLASSYFEDSKYFYGKGKYLEALELLSYLWGILDACARLKLIDPGEFRKYFKIDQE